MVSSIGRRFRAVVPTRLTSILRSVRQERLLRRVEAAEIGEVPLISKSDFEGMGVIDDSMARAAEAVDGEIGPVFAEGALRGAINPGDRRAIYSLVRRFRPRRVLEIGTHVGASTVYIAKALDAESSAKRIPRLVTVDVRDVNDSETRMWEQCGARTSPRDTLAKLNCGDSVEFVVSSSMEFFQRTMESFDFIFLDGSHQADVVYREIVGSLRILTRGGCILLHDFFPKGERIWRDREAVPGPSLAVERLRHEGARIDAIPLGVLPWKTKLESNVTSLAILVKDADQVRYPDESSKLDPSR